MKMMAIKAGCWLRLLVILLSVSVCQTTGSVSAETGGHRVPEKPSPELGKAAMGRGMVAVKEKDWEAAFKHFQEARRSLPYAPPILFNSGFASDQAGDGREIAAIAFYKAFLVVAPKAKNANAVRKRIGVLKARIRGRAEKLIRLMEEAVSAFPSDSYESNSGKASLAAVYASIGDFDRALKGLANVNEFHSGGAIFNVARFLAAWGRFDEALVVADRLRSTASKVNYLAGAYSEIAGQQAKFGYTGGALKNIRFIDSLINASEADTNSRDIMRRELGTAYLAVIERLTAERRFSDARAVLEQAAALATRMSERNQGHWIYLKMVLAYIHLGDLAAAYRFAKKAAAEDKYNGKLAFLRMAFGYAAAGETDLARDAYSLTARDYKMVPESIEAIETARRNLESASTEAGRADAQWLLDYHLQRMELPVGPPEPDMTLDEMEVSDLMVLGNSFEWHYQARTFSRFIEFLRTKGPADVVNEVHNALAIQVMMQLAKLHRISVDFQIRRN